MRICDFVDWHTWDICWFAIAEWDQEFADLWTLKNVWMPTSAPNLHFWLLTFFWRIVYNIQMLKECPHLGESWTAWTEITMFRVLAVKVLLMLYTSITCIAHIEHMYRVGNLIPAVGARNQVGIGLSYRPAAAHVAWLLNSRLGSWNRFLAPKQDLSFRLRLYRGSEGS